MLTTILRRKKHTRRGVERGTGTDFNHITCSTLIVSEPVPVSTSLIRFSVLLDQVVGLIACPGRNVLELLEFFARKLGCAREQPDQSAAWGADDGSLVVGADVVNDVVGSSATLGDSAERNREADDELVVAAVGGVGGSADRFALTVTSRTAVDDRDRSVAVHAVLCRC